jgi:hypothetical protein
MNRRHGADLTADQLDGRCPIVWSPDRVFHKFSCGCEFEQEWCGPWDNSANCRLAVKMTCAEHLERVNTYRYHPDYRGPR